MNKLIKIFAFISFFVILTLFTGAVSAANLTITPQNSIQAVINNTHNSKLVLKDSNESSHIYKDNLNGNISKKNTTGIVMAANNYNCGPAALATVLQSFGINTTDKELAKLAGTDKNGTNMYGLVQAAQKKGLVAKGLRLKVSELEPGNIVFLTINGKGHFSVIKNITSKTVYLADPNLGNINMTLVHFKASYSGDALVVTNNANNKQLTRGTKLTEKEMQKIRGMRYDIDWPRTGVKLAGCALIAFGALTLDPVVVIGGIATVSSAYVR